MFRCCYRQLLSLVIALTSAFSFCDVVDYQYRVVETFPHSTNVFTQGLIYQDGQLYESSGHYGQSRLISRKLHDSQPVRQQHLARAYFAEGITIMGDKLYQLTWKSRRGFIYNKDSFQSIGEFQIKGEGWGITHNGKQLIISDGSNQLSFLDPDSFEVTRTVEVFLEGKPIHRLNELEWIDGVVYANVWGSNWIVMIDPDSGRVTGKVHLNQLLPVTLKTARTDVLNGIAFDKEGRRLLVTGKYWPQLYHIELIAPDSATDKPQS